MIREWLKQHDIVLVGRYSEWEYYNSDHAFLAGKRGAEEVRKLQAKSSGGANAMGTRLRDAGEKGWTGNGGLGTDRAALKEGIR